MITLNYSFVKWFSIASLFFFFGGATHLFSGEEGTGTGALKVLFYPLALVIYSFSFFVAYFSSIKSEVVRLTLNYSNFTLPFIFILLSMLWSYDLSESVRRGFALFGTSIFGVAIGLYFGKHQFALLLRDSLFIVVAVSFFLALLVPDLGTHVGGEFDGLWRGALSFKNQAGWVASIFCLLWIFLPPASKTIWLVGFLLGMSFLLKTGSATGIISFLFGIAILVILRFFGRGGNLLVLSLIFSINIIIVALFYLVINIESLLGLLGKDLTLTGRLSIWISLIPHIQDKLLIGYGYAAFWPNVEDFFGYSWMAEINHAHNGYIELLVDLGLVGFLFCLLFLIKTFVSLLFRAATFQCRSLKLFSSLWGVCLLIGLSGKVFYVPNGGIWVMMVGMYVSLWSASRVGESDV